MAQNRPLWRLMSTFGGCLRLALCTHSGARQRWM